MSNGIVEQLGTAREIYEHPATKFVAGFIGTSNLFAGTVREVTEGNAVITAGPEERIVVPVQAGRCTPGGELELTVRPEKIRISTAPPRDTDCAVRGVVIEVIYLGTSTNYNVRTSAGVDVTVFTQNATSADDVAVRGDSVWLSWEPRHSYAIGA
jgi:spermidine/putrescine transport system ATP-binding protein